MAYQSNRYFLNGLDMWDTYGYIVSEGSDDLLRPPAMDDPFSHKFSDRDGRQWDLIAPTFSYTEATIKGKFITATPGEFWTKYNALFGRAAGVLMTPGKKTLTVTEFDRVFEVFYRDVPNILRYTRIKDNAQNKIAVHLDIRFEVLNSYPVTGLTAFYADSVGAGNYPDTWAEIIVLNNQPEYYGNIIELNTGTVNRTFAIAIPATRLIKRVIDLSASNVNLTALFELQATVSAPGGISYKVYGFTQSIPYSVNHVYRIELI